MPSPDPDVAPRRLVTGSVLPARSGPAPRLAFGAARRSVSRAVRGWRHRPQLSVAPLLVLVPAHDAEDTVGRCLTALLTQTRVPQRVVLLAADCTDRTEEIARRFPEVTVMRTLATTGGRADALDQGWRRWQAGYDRVAVVDADTVLAPDGLQRLDAELSRTARPGSVCVRSMVDRGLGSTALARALVRTLDPDAAPWAVAPPREGRHPVGGRVVLYDADALRAVTARNRTRSPWDPAGPVEDAQLGGDLRLTGHRTLVSRTARAHAGPRLTLRSAWARHAAPTDHPTP